MVAESDRPFEFHPQAREKLLEAGRWYSDADQAVGTRFYAAVDAAIQQVVRAPHRWPPYMHGTRRYVMRQFPYLLVYRERGGTVQIVAVAHAKRKPGYWADRVDE